LTYKYPDRLASVYERILRVQSNVPSGEVTAGIRHSSLPIERKASLLLEGASSANWRHRGNALQNLGLFDQKLYANLMITNLASILDPSGNSVWTAHETNFASLILGTSDARVWKELGVVARSSEVTKRVSLLSPSWYTFYTSCEESAKKEFVRFLVSFLNDDTVHPPMQTGGAEWSESFQVRNYAAVELGKIFRVPLKARSDWTPEQWNDFRETARASSGKYLELK
jgi:hypothetical protein